jgi:hypothetical protein
MSSYGSFSSQLYTWAAHYRTRKLKLYWSRKDKSVSILIKGLQMRNNNTICLGSNKTVCMSNKAFTSMKWMLTVLSGLLTMAFIIFLEH